MSVIELLIIAIGLSMDAFAVSICQGLSMRKMEWKKAGIIGLYFGVFQAFMPCIGYLLGIQFKTYIVAVDHWIAWILLVFIGANMIKEAFGKEETEAKQEADIRFKNMLALAIATSIDALAIGVTFAFFLNKAKMLEAVSFIGIITFTLSFLGVKIGNVFGEKYKAKAELAGGIILILMGFKILLEHIGVFSF